MRCEYTLLEGELIVSIFSIDYLHGRQSTDESQVAGGVSNLLVLLHYFMAGCLAHELNKFAVTFLSLILDSLRELSLIYVNKFYSISSVLYYAFHEWIRDWAPPNLIQYDH